ncbi:nucleoside recognition domain-containing protein [Brevibacillus humidisoli]|uniref:nucleoside recognition domain-containing protein n=1 Tax=Brevibacillus humidisoli TaxID=2895522 RepID=UPI001E2B0052|nr:nucleoside recognition domain-containing protein [Brevibacillus humidisoli]UFJ39531.1 nucleoside recognition domain-containing protein [Brevibacillus humidisoli]
MITAESWKKGLGSGMETTWRLGKVIFPITLIITILQHTPVIDWIVKLFAPVMSLFGLSGDAALILVLGNVLNLYAAIGAMLTMTMSVKEVFILSVMLSFSHNLFVESAVASRIGVKTWIIVSVRLGLAFLSGILINLLWRGGAETAVYGIVPEKQAELNGWLEIGWHGLQTALIGIIQLAVIVIPLMIGIQLLKDVKALPYLAKGLAPFTRTLGVSEKTGVTLMAGLIFGIAYGAGAMIQAAKEDNLSKKDLYLTSLFLVACHAVIEDTLLFVPLGVNGFLLLGLRFVGAVVLTVITAKIWTHMENKGHRLQQGGAV